ncbi:MAG TPA: matrixin family metalloprotease, partial [Planctomycetia bacterium]|nr:matrixin family metalloprotease [Planctomycetia bacterium]
ALAGRANADPPNYDVERWNGFTAIGGQTYTQGSPLTLTWGFMALGTPINDSVNSGFGNGVNNLQTRLNTIYGNQATWQAHFQSVFDRWSSISGLTYQFEANDDGAAIGTNTFPAGQLGVRADLRIGGKSLDGNNGVLAYNYYPNVGEMVIDTNDTFFNSTTGNSLGLRNVVSHEHGHGMGMPHVNSGNASFLMEPFFSSAFDGPQYHDILAAQRMYGDAREKGAGNNTAATANSLGVVSAGSPRTLGNSARTLVVNSTSTDFVSIDDDTDVDFYSFTVSLPGQVSILLESLGFTYNLGEQGVSGEIAFDTRLRSDLRLALFGVNGTSMLASANIGGLGVNEQIVFNLLAGGTYFIRVTGADNADSFTLDTQFYGLTVNFTPVPEPGTIGLLAGAAAGFFGWRRRIRRAA